MPQRISAGLGINAQAVRSLADRNPLNQMPIAGVDRVDFAVVPASQPKNLTIRGHPAHIRAGMPRYGPLSNDLSILKTDDGDGAFVAIRAIEELRIPAGVKAMGSSSGWNETDSRKCVAVNDVH